MAVTKFILILYHLKLILIIFKKILFKENMSDNNNLQQNQQPEQNTTNNAMVGRLQTRELHEALQRGQNVINSNETHPYNQAGTIHQRQQDLNVAFMAAGNLATKP